MALPPPCEDAPLRLDDLLVRRGYYSTRSRARDAIERGTVCVDGQPARKAGQPVAPGAAVDVDDPARRYVSRAALKLLAGLDRFGLDPAGAVALDIGASTGGFTQVLLERGAAAGDGARCRPWPARSRRLPPIRGPAGRRRQRTRSDGRRSRRGAAGFHRLRRQLHLAAGWRCRRRSAWRGRAAAAWPLVKPQFEAGRAAIGKGGMVRDPAAGGGIAEELRAWLDGHARLAGARPRRVADRRRRRQSRIPARRDQGPVSTTLTIARLGAQGDGIAETGAAGAVFVPFALPGETVTVARAAIGARAELLDVITPSPSGSSPPCRHFGSCGGCAHPAVSSRAPISPGSGTRSVEALRREASRRRSAIVACAPGQPPPRSCSRRGGPSGGVLLGYNRALSHDIVDIVECPIADAGDRRGARPSLRQLAGLISRRARDAFRLTVTATAAGVGRRSLRSGKLSTTSAAAQLRRFATGRRLCPAVDRRRDRASSREVRRSISAALPSPRRPAVSCRRSQRPKHAMAELVVGHLAGARRVADLFSGCGAFALRLGAAGRGPCGGRRRGGTGRARRAAPGRAKGCGA